MPPPTRGRSIRSSGPDAIRSACSIADVAFASANRRWASPATPSRASNASQAKILDRRLAGPPSRAAEVRLEVVVGEELDELLGALARGLLDPRRHGRVCSRPLPSGKALVGDLAREDVLEDELRLTGDRRGESRQDQLPLLQTVERGPQPVAVAVQQAADGSRARTRGRRPPRAGARASRRGPAGRSWPRARPAPCPGSATSAIVRCRAPPFVRRGRSRPRRSGGGRSPRGRTGCPPARSRIRSCTDDGRSATDSSSPTSRSDSSER